MIVNGTDMLYMDEIDGCYIKEFEAEIIGKDTDDKGRTYLVLDRSIFYPMGGGQPTDTGILTWEEPGSGEERSIRIERVSRKAEIRHYPEANQLVEALPVGTKVRGSLDWERRYSLMRMHTTQHLISSIAYNIYNAYTVGNQIYADRSRIDFSPLSHESVDIQEIERQCNEFIRINPQVKVFFEKRSEIEAAGDADRCNVHLIPEFIQELRIVKIEEVELCPCAGTHIRELGEAGEMKITSVRSKGKGKVRITYELN